MQRDGLHAIFEQNRGSLLRYFRAHGAGDSAEDCLQELWLKVSASNPGPIGSPRNFLFRAATNLMIDRRRSEFHSQRRDNEWSDLAGRRGDGHVEEPDAERQIAARQHLEYVERRLRELPPRVLDIFRRHRIDGRTQRAIAAELGISPSTVENDLRLAYRLLAEIRERLDEE